MNWRYEGRLMMSKEKTKDKKDDEKYLEELGEELEEGLSDLEELEEEEE